MAWMQVEFYSNILQRTVPLQILLPADYTDPKANKRWKTLYLLHGFFGNCSDWVLMGDAQGVSNDYDLCVVMPSGNNDFYVNAPYGIRDSARFVSEELVDFTRRLLPLSHKREDTLIGGLSMGGFGTLYNALTYSEVFGAGIALSSALVLEKDSLDDLPDEPNFMGVCKGYYQEVFGEDLSLLPDSDMHPRVAAEKMLAAGKPIPNLYIACGVNDMLKYPNRKLSKALTDMGIVHVYEEGPGTHEWNFWKLYLRKGLNHILGGAVPTMPNPFWVDDEEGSAE